MTMNIFALCKIDDTYEAKEIPLNPNIRSEVEAMFQAQKDSFRQNFTTEVTFNGDWKADDDEIFTIPIPDEANVIVETFTNCRPANIPVLDLSQFQNNPIKAIFASEDDGNTILIQRFYQNQYLSRRLSFFLEDGVYNKLDTPAISFDNKLLCIIENRLVKFNNFSNMRCVFDVKEYYVEATDAEIEVFGIHPKISIDDIEAFKRISNQSIRKIIHNLSKSGILDDYTADEIKEKADSHGIENLITIENNKIILPIERKETLKILSFLDEKLYKGVFSDETKIANSTRTV